MPDVRISAAKVESIEPPAAPRRQRFMSLALALSLLAVTGAEPAGAPPPPPDYDQKYLSVEDELVVVDGDSSKVHRIYQGKYKKSLAEDQFYRLVGKPELADFVVRRERLKLGLVVGGLAAVVVGSVILVKAINAGCERDIDDPLFGECVQMNAARNRNPAGGLLLFFGGTGAALAGLIVNSHPAGPEEMRRLADEYNRSLATGARAERRFRLQPIPYAGPGGGGLVLRGAF
jgi:hypothetical protein